MNPRVNRLWPIIAAGILAAAGAVAFGSYLRAPFLFDDLHTITQNPALKTLDPIFFLTHPESASRLPGTMVRPLLTLTYALDLRRAGPDPAAFRLVNLLLHLACALLVFALVGRTRLRVYRLEAALLFLLLPLSAVQVGYISNRSVLLSSLFYLGGIVLFAAAADRSLPRVPALVGMAGCYALGLLAKDSAATLPAAVALWGLLFLRDRGGRRLTAVATAGLLAVFAAYLAYRFALRAPSFFPAARPWPVWAYAASQVPVTMRYLGWMALPANLAIVHDAWMPVAVTDLLSAPFIAGLAGIAALAVAGLRARRSAPELAFGVGLFFLYLLPTNSLIPLVMPANENRPYLSALLLVLGLAAAAGMLRKRGRAEYLARAVLIAVAALFLVLVRARAADFGSPLTAWRQAAKEAPHSHRVWHNLGLSYLDYGRAREAGECFRRAIAVNPCAAQSRNSLGNLIAESDPARAAEFYRQALECDPTASGARINLAEWMVANGRVNEGVKLLHQGLRYDPRNPELWGRLGETLLAAGTPQARSSARDYLIRARDLDPDPARSARWSQSLRRISE